MAKKKGGKKKSKTSSKKMGGGQRPKSKKRAPSQSKKAPAPVEEPVVEEAPEEIVEEPPFEDQSPPEEVPEPDEEPEEPEAPPEEEETKLSDAVSAVISGESEEMEEDEEEEKKEEKKKSPTYKKREKLLLGWAAEGYNVDELEALLESGKTKGVKKAFDTFEANVKKIEEMKEKMADLDQEGLEDEVAAFEEYLSRPADLKDEELEQEFAKLTYAKRAQDINKELDGMVLDSLKERVAEMRQLLEDPENLEEVEKKLVDLKKDYKEAYFEEGVESFVQPAEEAAVKKSAKKPSANGKAPMEVKDIFLLYKDGKFVSHHTARVVPKDEQEQLFADLKTGRNYLKSPNYKPQKLNVISVNGRKILVQGGQYTVIIMVVTGDVNPWTEKIINKVQTLLEKEDKKALQSWDGDVASLKSAGKYMTALLYACMKLSKKK